MDKKKQLIALIEAGSIPALEAFFEGMLEPERGGLAKTALAQLKLGLGRHAEGFGGALVYRPDADREDPRLEAAALSVWATGGVREFDDVFPLWLPDPPMEVFWSRSEAVIQAWAAHLDDYAPGANWELAQSILRKAKIELPRGPEYTVGMIYAAKDAAGALLKRNPELLDGAIWEIFEVEDTALSTMDPVDGSTGSWSNALIEAMEAGRLPRARLLQSSLQALQSGFSAYAARWYLKFFDALKPSQDELKAAREIFLQLLSAPAASIASWALKKVKVLYKGGAYCPTQLCAALAPALAAEQKGTVRTALSLLKQIARPKDGPRAEALRAACAAFAHPDAGVQEAALELLERYPAVPLSGQEEALQWVAAGLADRLRDRLGLLAEASAAAELSPPDASGLRGKSALSPAAQSAGGRVRRVLGLEEPQGGCEGRKTQFCASRRSRDLQPPVAACGDVHGFSEELLRAYRIPELLAPRAEDARWSIPAAEFSFGQLPELSLRAPLTPIGGWPELIEVCARLIEGGGRAEDFELALDGFCRRSNSRPPDPLYAPLLKRAEDKLKRLEGAPFTHYDPIADLCGLIYCWGKGAPPRRRFYYKERWGAGIELQLPELDPLSGGDRRGGLEAALSERFFCVAERSCLGRSGPLLSAPTHEGFWIDPSALVSRLAALEEEPLADPRWAGWWRIELQLTLLRLAPDGRAEALSRLPEGAQEHLQALRHALGGEATIGADPCLWAAAARARDPEQEDPAVCAAFDCVDRRIGRPARYDPRVQDQTGALAACEALAGAEETGPVKAAVFGFERGLPTRGYEDNKPPTDTQGNLSLLFERLLSLYWVEWAVGEAAVTARRGIWPAGRAAAHTFSLCYRPIGELLDNTKWCKAAFIQSLLDPGAPLGPEGALLLVVGLATREASAQSLAVDAAHRAIAQGRLGSEGLALALCRLLDRSQLMPQRLTDSLQTIADAYPGVVKLALEPLCLRAKDSGRQLGGLMELLLELSARMDCGVAPEHGEALKGIKGSSKTAKAARALLKLPRVERPKLIEARYALARERISAAAERMKPGA